MDPITLAGIVSGVGSFSSGLSSAIGTAISSKKQYKYNLALQQQAQQWQERMSNTAHQREVKDLREAGLNPILSATGGSGASTGSVGANSVGQADYSSAVDAYYNAKLAKSNIKTQESQQDLNKQQANKAQYEADAAHSAAAYQNEQTRQLMEFGPQQAQANINLTNAQAEATRNSAVATKIDTDFSKEHPFLYGLSRIGGPAAGLAGVGVAGYSAYQTNQTNKAKLKAKK